MEVSDKKLDFLEQMNDFFDLGTIYPGLMVTSAVIYHLCWLLNITVDIRNVCVFLAPLFSSLTTIVTYLLTKELRVSQFKFCMLITI